MDHITLMRPSYEILTPIDGNKILKNIELAGRTAYKSEDKITEDSAEKFCRAIIKRGHHSVVEHESISVKFVFDRAVGYELIRHRLASFTQESSRFCSYNNSGCTFIIPPWISQLTPGQYTEKNVTDWWSKGLIDAFDESEDNDIQNEQVSLWLESMWAAANTYDLLLTSGWSPQQARSVLPNSLKTEIITSANLREWRHIFTLRTSGAAHPQMQEIMRPLLDELKEKIPVLFDDISY